MIPFFLLFFSFTIHLVGLSLLLLPGIIEWSVGKWKNGSVK